MRSVGCGPMGAITPQIDRNANLIHLFVTLREVLGCGYRRQGEGSVGIFEENLFDEAKCDRVGRVFGRLGLR